jgi:putative hydrolase of the HAD superfamily
LTVYRIEKFNLKSFIGFFVSSCFVHFRQPDMDIYRSALDISQAEPPRSYLDDRLLCVEIAQSLGINGIHHPGIEKTRNALKNLGVTLAA